MVLGSLEKISRFQKEIYIYRPKENIFVWVWNYHARSKNMSVYACTNICIIFAELNYFCYCHVFKL